MLRRLSVASLLIILSLGPALEVRADEFPSYSDQEFQELIDIAFEDLPSLDPEVGPLFVTGDPSIDDRIWEIAYARGYQLQPYAMESGLAERDGHSLQQAMAIAWEDLQLAAALAGHNIAITSAYRPPTEQREIFLGRLPASPTDAQIDERLELAAPPGASRHQTGYAVDIREIGDSFGDFGATDSHEWLAANNYENAKQHGFVPSYPPGVTDAGPRPEPWEWVYVGTAILAGARAFSDVPLDHFAEESIVWMKENGHTNGCGQLRYCPDQPTTRGEIAAFFKRVLEPYLGQVEPESFDDTTDHLFEDAVGWLAGHGITLGCDPPQFTRFCPDESVTRGQISAMIKRAVGHLIVVDPEAIDSNRFGDTQESVFVDSAAWLATTGITVGCNPPANNEFCPDASVTRAQMAVFLKRMVDRL